MWHINTCKMQRTTTFCHILWRTGPFQRRLVFAWHDEGSRCRVRLSASTDSATSWTLRDAAAPPLQNRYCMKSGTELLYTPWYIKRATFIFTITGKCGSILIILSLWHLQRNCRRSCNKILPPRPKSVAALLCEIWMFIWATLQRSAKFFNYSNCLLETLSSRSCIYVDQFTVCVHNMRHHHARLLSAALDNGWRHCCVYNAVPNIRHSIVVKYHNYTRWSHGT